VKSVTPERLDAMAEIGVTHARFGLQTFSPEYRRAFALTATIGEIESAVKAFQHVFPYVSCDMLYGMNGQTETQLACDVQRVCELALQNIDFYPINNVVTQYSLHDTFAAEGKRPLSGLTKFYMNVFIREAMREHGYLPHNAHGYVRVPPDELDRNPVVTECYSFVYHEHVYGRRGYDLLGFGTNAVSSFEGFTVSNHASRRGYIKALQSDEIPMTVRQHDANVDACRPLALALPYHGVVKSECIDWVAVPDYVKERFQELLDARLIHRTKEAYSLTREGWEWYSSIMYYLLPDSERRAVDKMIAIGKSDDRRLIENSGLEDVAFTHIV
jgi:oxygen-independent coproporphyrinogen-3 oxidase